MAVPTGRRGPIGLFGVVLTMLRTLKGALKHMISPQSQAMVSPPPPLHRGARAVLKGLLRTMRPLQWTKNGFVFAGLIFGGEFLQPSGVLRVLAAFGVFCLLASGVYFINDLMDRERDGLHPKKRDRPLASGLLRPSEGAVAAVVLAGGGLAAAAWLGQGVLWVGLGYLAQNLLYSFWLKHVPLWDALTVSVGFVLRSIAGTMALGIAASPWLLVCTYLLALYLSLGKRWSDAVLLSPEERAYRKAALLYEPDLVRLFMQVSMAATLISYALYAVQGPHSPWILLTLPFVIYGLFHYQHMVESRALGGSPESAIFQDRGFLLNGAAYVVAAVGVLLLSPHRGA